MPDRVGQQLGNYRLIRLLGRGGFADVYLGEHLYLKNRAALKVLRTSLADEDVEQFLAEAQTLARLTHPNIVRVLDFAVERGNPFLVMEYAPRGTMRQHHPRGSYLSLETTTAYVKQVAAALQYAHNHNVIHRDIKPENILLASHQQVLLSDFGLALFSPAPEQLSTQEMSGTLPYMAPEQFHGRPRFTSDQYSLGIVVYEWLCGVRPFEGSAWQIMNQHLSAPPPPLREKDPSLPKAVEEVVLKALAKDPEQRYVSMQRFAQAFEQASQQDERALHADSEVTSPLHPIELSPSAISRRVFLSASRADDAFIRRLTADLRQRGMTICNEPQETTGDETPHEGELARRAIRAADLVLQVASPHARSSRALKEHLQIAGIYRRPVLCVWAEGDDIVKALPSMGEQPPIIDARQDRYEKALAEIMPYLERELPDDSSEESYPTGPVGEPRNPYKGLRAFTGDDATDFFGRDTLIAELIGKVKEMLAPEQPGMHAARMLAVLGPSGSGKSSAVMAGLLPRLQQGALPGSEHWVYLKPMKPGTHPVEALTLTLAPCFPDKSLKSLRENLEDESARGLQLLTRRLVKEAGQKVVLLVDQFEELFTQTASEDERRRFIDLLTTAVREPRGWVILLLTLRADLYDRPMAYPELGRLILGHQTLVLPMDIHELRAAIKQPAALPDVQLTFERNMVGDLLYEVQGQIGALPLLQFTLEQLFVRRNDHLLTYHAYTEIGGVKGALAKQAESTYAALPSEEHRKLARSLFLRLIDPGVQDATRRRASLSELSLSTPEETELLHQVTAYFLAARLLTTNEIAGTPTIEVSHEALIREWSRLSDWLWEARDDVRLQQSLSEDAAGWEQRGKPRDRLYRGSQLKEARAWARGNIPSTSEVAFLRASATHRVLSAVSVLAVLLVVVSSIATAGWFLTHQAPDPTQVTNLQDQGPGSLHQAIDVAPAGSTITFDAALSGTIILTSELNITRNLTIRGPVAHTLSISSGESGHRVHVMKGFSVTISNLIFKDSTIGLKSFIYNEGTLTLTNSTVSDNIALFDGGGGIDNLGTLTLTNSTVSGNRADFAGGSKGGGIFNLGTLTLTNSTVSGNTVTHGDGGGIDNEGTLTLSNSTVSGNSASSSGGGIFTNFEDTLSLTNSTVSGNSASGPNGVGGIDNEGTLTLSNSTVSGNSASGPNGIGGIKIASFNCQTCSPAQADLIFSTIYGNRGSGGADIVIKDESSTQRSQVKISNSIVVGDSAHWGADIAGMLTSHGYNLFQDNSGATFDPATSDLHGTDKTLSVNDLPSLFASPVGLRGNGGQTWTYALGANSPAIDQVPLRYCQVKDIFNDRSGMYTDQRGVKRPDGNENACDIGAYENVDQQV